MFIPLYRCITGFLYENCLEMEIQYKGDLYLKLTNNVNLTLKSRTNLYCHQLCIVVYVLSLSKYCNHQLSYLCQTDRWKNKALPCNFTTRFSYYHEDEHRFIWLKMISFSLNYLFMFLAHSSIGTMFCFKNKTILDSSVSRKEIPFKPNFVDGKKKSLIVQRFQLLYQKTRNFPI